MFAGRHDPDGLDVITGRHLYHAMSAALGRFRYPPHWRAIMLCLFASSYGMSNGMCAHLTGQPCA